MRINSLTYPNFKIFLSFFFLVKDYFYLKTSGYFIVVQVVVDCNKRFYNVCQGLIGNVSDFRVLFKHVQYDNLFDVSKGCGDDILPYLLGR